MAHGMKMFLFLAVMCGCVALYYSRGEKPAAQKVAVSEPAIVHDMTKAELRKSIGRPDRIIRTSSGRVAVWGWNHGRYASFTVQDRVVDMGYLDQDTLPTQEARERGSRIFEDNSRSSRRDVIERWSAYLQAVGAESVSASRSAPAGSLAAKSLASRTMAGQSIAATQGRIWSAPGMD
jgi:hypothetical protein